jgi:protein-tyrosine phosphatase
MPVIDFHVHILPDLDDGPPTLAAALELARLAVADGIHTLVATPHSPTSGQGHRYSVEGVQQRLAALRAALDEQAISLEVLPGSELHYHPALAQHLAAGLVLPCGDGGAVLLECPNSYLPGGLDQLIFDLQIAGYRVVLAHPERIKPVRKDPNLLLPLIERGVLMQLTADALTGKQGHNLQQAAETLLTHGMAHLLASDAHGPPPRRTPHLAAAHDYAARLVGEQAAAALVHDTPAALLHGKAPPVLIPPRSIAAPRRRRWFWL